MTLEDIVRVCSLKGAKDLDEKHIEYMIKLKNANGGRETGIDVSQLPDGALRSMNYSVEYDIYPQWRHRYPPGVEKNTEHWFQVELPTRMPITLAPREHIAFRWESISVASSLCFSPSNQEAILQLKIK